MKTALEWFEELPNGYRELAIANLNNPDINFGEDEGTKVPKLTDALSMFKWHHTAEGTDFWARVHRYYYHLKSLPPIPNK
jgi:hypothetical protein